MIIPVILCGGTGSRLWPLSRDTHPKQLLSLLHPQHSLLQQTALRAQRLNPQSTIIVICNHEYRFTVGEQLQQIGIDKARIILEPQGRSTAPAIAVAAWRAQQLAPDPLLWIMPADHVIGNEVALEAALDTAQKASDSGALVTFGVVPRHPETGYGYIQSGPGVGDNCFQVKAFKEKPDAATAATYLANGGYYWNSGMFMFRARSVLTEIQTHAPEVYTAAQAAVARLTSDLVTNIDFERLPAEQFNAAPEISIDYAVLEKTDHALVVPLVAEWNDIGSWSVLWEASHKDALGNSTQGDVVLQQVRNSYVHSENQLVAAIGVDNLVVVVTADAVLVMDKDQAQQVRQIVDQLTQQHRPHTHHHRQVYRPWGWYESLVTGAGFQVKQIHVKPGARLSVQKHRHRSEHWVVVQGQAEVLNGEQTSTLNVNQSTYIPAGTVHSLKNPSLSETLEIIEVQSGSYLGEDDIVRLDDQYGRC